jgi:hypothetical protein
MTTPTDLTSLAAAAAAAVADGRLSRCEAERAIGFVAIAAAGAGGGAHSERTYWRRLRTLRLALGLDAAQLRALVGQPPRPGWS